MKTRFILLSVCALFAGSAWARAAQGLAGEHRIGVRNAGDGAELYDRDTGAPFVPRGTNYVELRPDPTHSFLISSLFFPAYHDAEDVERDFERMQALGFNTVRVFVDLCRGEDCIGRRGGGLRDDYMDNVVSLLRMARQHHLFVLLTANWLPDFGGYLDAHATCTPTFEAGNCLLLSDEGVDAYRRFFRDFVQALLDRDAPLDAILGYELRNEVFFEEDQPPLSWSTGTVTTANGVAYDMASPGDRARMIDDGLAYWANQTRDAILALDPTALVTAGFFAPDAPNGWRPGDTRLVRTSASLYASDLDFLDFHGYPDAGLSMEQLVENYGATGYRDKPVILGEMGAFRHLYPAPQAAAEALQSWQSAACQAGFDGFLLWYWDPLNSALVGDNVWGALAGLGDIAHVVAPVFTPDPCAVGPGTNLALGKPATASAALDGQPPSAAVDGRLDTNWGAGSHPPQWIEIDLQRPVDVGRIRLLTEQYPAGYTVHRVLGRRTAGGAYTLLHSFSGETDTGQWLEQTPAAPWSGIRWVRVETTTSPSWVSWSEIRVYPQQTDGLLPLPPALLSPAPRAVDVTAAPLLQWQAVAGADTYDVQLAPDPTLGEPSFDASGLVATQVDPGLLGHSTTYYWHVRAVNDVGPGPWSATRQLTVGTGTATEGETLQGSLGLTAAYPNPFHAYTTLRFTLPSAAFVRLVIYDAMGRRLTTLLSERMSPGTHCVVWHPSSTASGVFFYRLTAGDADVSGSLLRLW